MTTKTIEQCYCVDYIDWAQEIKVNITDELKEQITKAKALINDNHFVRDISIEVPNDFWIDEDYEKLYNECAFDVSKIHVYDIGVFLSIQGKWDCSHQAEYDLGAWKEND